MDEINALNILELFPPKRSLYSSQDIRRQYLLLSLKYHPDKTHISDSNERFQSINAAYHFLVDNPGTGTTTTTSTSTSTNESSFGNMMHYFVESLSSFYKKEKDTIHKFLNKAMKGTMKNYLKNASKEKCESILTFMTRYRHFLHFTQEEIDEVNNILNEKLSTPTLNKDQPQPQTNNISSTKLQTIIEESEEEESDNDSTSASNLDFDKTNANTHTIIIRPSFDDIVHDRIYQIIYKGSTYFVPSWNEMNEYDENLVVKCLPNLPENIYIDADNHVHIYPAPIDFLQSVVPLIFSSSSSSSKSNTLDIKITDKYTIPIPIDLLSMKASQIYVLYGQGMIREEETEEILYKDNPERGHIYIHLNFWEKI